MMQTALQVIYPPRCLSCGGLVEGETGLCGPCWRDTPFLGGTVCNKCGTELPGQAEAEGAICDDCLVITRPWDRGRAALGYRDTGRTLVLALKHGDRHDIAAPAARWMVSASRNIITADSMIVPVPLHIHRLLARRFNQSALLAQAMATATGCCWSPDALVRVKPTRSLDGLSRDERFVTMANMLAPSARHGQALAGRNVVIVDDVMTSGATLAAATEAAFAAGAKQVCVSVLARVTKEP